MPSDPRGNINKTLTVVVIISSISEIIILTEDLSYVIELHR